MKEIQLKVLSNQKIAENIYEMQFSLPKGLSLKSGQFLNIATGSSQHLLRRPIAIASLHAESFSICYQVKGSGTQSLKNVAAGAELAAVLPLGNYFKMEKNYTKVALLGGGVGIFPLLAVLQEYKGVADFYSYMGFRAANAICKTQEFIELSKKATFTTDDGSFGQKGNVVQAFLEDVQSEKFDAVFACGPLPMLRALKTAFAEHALNIPCYISLEERMGCGIGACLVCVCKTPKADKNLRVCKDGPIFELGEVQL